MRGVEVENFSFNIKLTNNTAQTLPTPITIPTLRTLGEKTLFLIDLGTYQSLDEGQRKTLKQHGLVVNTVNSK